jgi:hypothetical protein
MVASAGRARIDSLIQISNSQSSKFVIASASEAIHRNKGKLDCFVASAPRNDVDDDAPPSTVIPRAGGVSSTPRAFGSITDASEYWIVRLRGR